MKHADRRTYDFSDGQPPEPAACDRVSKLMLDGWEAYYRWLTELEQANEREARQRRADQR